MTSLDLSKNTALSELDCFLNQIRGESMDALIASLPQGTNCEFVAVSDGDLELNVCTGPQAAAAKQKGWNLSCWYCLSEVDNPFEGGVTINEYNFPDATFRSKVLSLDTDGYGMLSDKDIQAVKKLNLSKKEIKNLTGIEYFTALTELYCQWNSLESLDVSKNTALTYLDCSVNSLKSLDVSKNTALMTLACEDNSLQSLDVTKNTALTYLSCFSNKLESLDVSKNTALKTLVCDRNSLESLDVSKNTALTWLNCNGNQIKGSSMDNLMNSLPDTQGTLIVCRDGATEDNVITKAQVKVATGKGWKVQKYTKNENNQTVSVDYAGVSVDIPIDATNFPDDNFRNYLLSRDYGKDGILTEEEIEAITELKVGMKNINDLTGIEHFTALTKLHCYMNSLKSLDVSKNTALTELNCCGCNMKSLDVTKNTALTELSCEDNSFQSLDVTKNTALTTLHCSFTGLTALNISKNTELVSLNCGYNSLTWLDISKNTKLEEIICYGNQVEGASMDFLVSYLPDTQGTLFVCDDNAKKDNVITKAQVKVATDKGWKVKKDTTSESDQWATVDYAGLGDVNCDNQINQDDLDLLVQIVMGQQPAYVFASAGDLNQDGKTDAADIVALVNILNGK